MSRPAHRLNDLCSGHGCFGPRPNIQGSPDYFVNSIPIHRQTDAWAVHCCPPPCHASIMCAGSPTYYVNGLQAARVGDPVCCGSVAMTGSSNCFIGP